MAYAIAPDIDIYWLDIHDGVLGVSDADGGITAIDHEDEFLWRAPGRGRSAWMVRCDDDAIYHGHSQGRDRLRAGDRPASCGTATTGAVLFGWQEHGSGLRRHRHPRGACGCPRHGATGRTYRCDAPSSPAPPPRAAGTSSPATASPRSTASTRPAPGCGSSAPAAARRTPCSTTTTGSTSSPPTATWPASTPASRRSARRRPGDVPEVRDVKAPRQAPQPVQPTIVEVDQRRRRAAWWCSAWTRAAAAGPGALRRLPTPTGRCSSPRGSASRAPATWSTEVRESSRGGFYRAYGDIRRLR